MKIVFLFLIALVGALARAEQLPPGWEEYVRYDQRFNVPSRRDEILGELERAIVPIYSVEIPRVLTESYQSKFLDDATRASAIVKREGKDRVRFYFTAGETALIEKLRAKGYAIKEEHWGTKMQSHATFFVWPKDGSTPGQPFFVKMQREGEKLGAPVSWNSVNNAELSVGNNDIVERAMPKPGEDPLIEIMPERFGAGLELGGVKYANTFRSAVAPDRGDGTKVVPLHGFIGEEGHIKPYADKAGLTPRQWYEREYLPKLAAFMARSHLRYGMHFEGHTQNLLVRLDPATGEIKSFVARDMNDVLFDAYARIASGLPAPQTRGSGTSQMNRFFVDLPEARAAGVHFRAYDSQAVYDADLPHRDQLSFFKLYFDAYKKEAEAIVGKPLVLSRSAQDHYAEVAAGRGFFLDDEDAGERLFQELHDRAVEARAPGYDPKTRDLYNQSRLVRIFRQKLGSEQVALLRANTIAKLNATKYENFAYIYDGKGIAVYEGESGEAPIAYAYGLSPDEHEIAGARPGTLTRFAMWCGFGLRNLFGKR